MKTHKLFGSLIISWDFTESVDKGVLIIGRQKNGSIEIVNAFQGSEAFELMKKLTEKSEGDGQL